MTPTERRAAEAIRVQRTAELLAPLGLRAGQVVLTDNLLQVFDAIEARWRSEMAAVIAEIGARRGAK